ncbi:uncharacterized protein N7446_003938 [Penicillium canescens]|uniref:Uncharacterized protein n=1 Tax=Penicillium canescens TaxID=5083 RepID=A0AAD6I385_PENCN|nr:uncharacterized protein N7446_003938 [Penicillium canescens]KAJ6027469.1 hypothetical protein N7460_012286 [Penicillium canescens]KAJ6040743.1 hypothetical protein N7444_009648 [Penicillium canescens]KAJ6066901.1 hypothetical protein N7446_003938 [Penicillium canescens]
MEVVSDLAATSEKPGSEDYNLPSFLDCREALRRRHFIPSQEQLRSILELSLSYIRVLDEDMHLARHLGLPLMSNTMAKNIDALFKSPRPQLIEAHSACEDNITWSEVADANYNPVPQEDGTYHLWISSRWATVGLSQFDHNILLPGIIQQLIHPLSHEPDVQMERETLSLATSEITSWNQIALELVETNKYLLEKLKEKANSLSSQESMIPEVQVPDCPEHVVAESQNTNSSKGGTKNLANNGKAWDPYDKDRVPKWFETRKHLPKKQIELEFERDFGHRRKHSSIYAVWYQKKGKEKSKRKKALRRQGKPSIPHDISHYQTTRTSDCNESSLGSTSNPENLLAVVSPPNDTYPTPESATEVVPMQTDPQSRRPGNASHTDVQHDMSMNAAECDTLDGVPEIEPTQSDTSARSAPTNGVEESRTPCISLDTEAVLGSKEPDTAERLSRRKQPPVRPAQATKPSKSSSLSQPRWTALGAQVGSSAVGDMQSIDPSEAMDPNHSPNFLGRILN